MNSSKALHGVYEENTVTSPPISDSLDSFNCLWKKKWSVGANFKSQPVAFDLKSSQSVKSAELLLLKMSFSNIIIIIIY